MDNNKINEAVFEALFSQAVIDNFNEEIDSIPSNEELGRIYSFSTEFEVKLKKLLKRDRRRDLIKTTMYYSKKVASIFIIVLGLLFSILLFNTEVRAAVGKVFVEWYEKFTSFTFSGEEAINERKEWSLTYLPKGSVLDKEEILGRVTNIEYINNQGDKIRFSYSPEESNTNISVDNENHKINKDSVLDNEAYSIIAIDDKFDNGLIWNMEGHTFNLWGKAPIDELKKIAESITEK